MSLIKVIQAASPVGCAWVSEYSRLSHTVEELESTLLSGRLEGISAALDVVDQFLEDAPMSCDSIRYALQRHASGVRALLRYREGAWADAEVALDRACTKVLAAISTRSELLFFLAMDSLELTLHRARVHRNRGDEDAMRRCIETASAMNADQIPLCTLSDGQTFYYTHIVDSIVSLESLSADVMRGYAVTRNLVNRKRMFELFVSKISPERPKQSETFQSQAALK